MNDRPNITVRPATAEDLRFIKASWYESYRHAAPPLSPDIYHAGHAKVIDDLLARGARAVVAVPTEVPDEVASWLVYEGNTIHYLYTKQVFRHMHVAMDLIRTVLAAGVEFKFHSHITRKGARFASFLRLRFNPYSQFHPVGPTAVPKE